MSRQFKTSVQYMSLLWLFTTILAIMVNCAPESKDGRDGSDGENCVVTQVDGGAEIKCGETTVVIFDGPEGPKGEDVCASILKRNKDHKDKHE